MVAAVRKEQTQHYAGNVHLENTTVVLKLLEPKKA